MSKIDIPCIETKYKVSFGKLFIESGDMSKEKSLSDLGMGTSEVRMATPTSFHIEGVM